MGKPLHVLTKEEIEIFEKGAEDPNILFGYLFSRPGSDSSFQLDYNFTEKGKWQVEFCMASQTFIVVIAGIGCSDIDSNIYDADLKRYVSIRWLIQNKRKPVVLSRTNNGWKKVQASEPYLKGRAEMVRVHLSDGNVVDVTLDHQFLTASQGYKHTRDLQVGELLVAPRNLPSTSQNGVVYAPIEKEILEDFQDHYLSDFRSRGEQPLSQSKAYQVSLPLQDDVLQSTHSTSFAPYSPPVLEQICTCHLGHSDILHQQKQCSVHLAVLQPVKGLPHCSYEATSELIRPYSNKARLSQMQSCGSSSQYWQDVLGEKSIDLGTTPFYDDEKDQIGWSYDDTLYADSKLPSLLQDAALQRSAFRVDQQDPAIPFQLCEAFDSPNNDLSNYYTPMIVRIEPLGQRDVFDIHVPVWNNYVMDGVVSHNTGKTLAAGMSAFYHAIMTPGFRFLNVARESWQSQLMYQLILENAVGTRAEEFIVAAPKKPYPTIVIDYIIPTPTGPYRSKRTLEFMSLGEKGDATNIFSWRGDWINLEEAGRIEGLTEIVSNLSTRLTGNTSENRPYMGRMSAISNPWENPDLWEMYDLACSDKEDGLGLEIETKENKNVTEDQLRRMLALIPEKERARYTTGKRPEGRGTYFPMADVEKCESAILSETLLAGVSAKIPGYIAESHPRIGYYHFEAPRKDDRLYWMVGDPGIDNAPNRNSPVWMVFDVTDAPKVSTLEAMWWGSGHGSITPFMGKMIDLITKYKPVICGMDNTSTQKHSAELASLQFVHGKGLSVDKIVGFDFSGMKRFTYLLCLKLGIEATSILYPSIARGLSGQLTNYDPFQDKVQNSKFPQDLVATMAMFAFKVKSSLGSFGQKSERQSFRIGIQPLIVRRSNREYPSLLRTSRTSSRRSK